MFSPNVKAGTVSQTSAEFQWAVKDIFSYTEPDVVLESPSFSVAGSTFHLVMLPYGEIEKSVGWISIFLFKEADLGNLKSVETSYGLAVKKVDESVEKLVEYCHVFDDTDVGWGETEFLKRSELLERKDELAPLGVLTVICTMYNERVKPVSKSLLRLSEDLQSMFVSKNDCDVTLKVGDEEFSVHKSILKSRSPVLKAMFEVDMKEKNTGVVDIKDCTPEAFKDFLLFIYCGKFTNSSNDAFQLYRIAHKYDVTELMEDCVVYITTNLSIDNVLDAAIIGHQFDEDGLKTKTQEFFNENLSKILLSSKWSSFSKDNFAVSDDLLRNLAKNMEKVKENHD